MELKGSRTEANLMAAFAGESQARKLPKFAPYVHILKHISKSRQITINII